MEKHLEKDATTFSVRERDSVAFRSDSEDSSNLTLKRAYRKIDLRLTCWYSLVFLFLQIEAHNITNAAILNIEAGTDIQHQLGSPLSSQQWAAVLMMPVYPFIVLQPFSTMLLKKIGPRWWMSGMMLAWGAVAMCTGATKSYAGLLVCRFCLGLAEAGFLPGVLYHLAFWYPTDRLPLRIAAFYAFAYLSGTLSGVLAFTISHLNGRAGLPGWRWLFIIEGMPAVLCAFVTFFLLPSYPADAKFLTETERKAVLSQIPNIQPKATDKTFNWKQVKSLFKDTTTYTFYFTWLLHVIGAKGVHCMLPTIIYELGMTNTATSQLMTIPPSLLGAVGLMLIAWLIRNQKLRPWVGAIVLEGFSCSCYVVLIAVRSPLVKYIFMMLTATASIGTMPILWPERIRATNGTTSAGLGIGLTASAAQVGGLAAAQVYQKQFGPDYTTSFGCSIALLAAVMLLISVTWVIVSRRDRRAGVEGAEVHGKAEQDPGVE